MRGLILFAAFLIASLYVMEAQAAKSACAGGVCSIGKAVASVKADGVRVRAKAKAEVAPLAAPVEATAEASASVAERRKPLRSILDRLTPRR